MSILSPKSCVTSLTYGVSPLLRLRAELEQGFLKLAALDGVGLVDGVDLGKFS
jgi:hypothetical protein